MIRSRVISEPAKTGKHRNYKNGVYQGTEVTTTMSSKSSGMIDTVSAGFRRRQKAGEIINNPCSMNVTERTTSGSGSVTQVQIASPYAVWTAFGDGTITGYYYSRGGGAPSYTECPIPDLSNATAIAKQRCLANIDSTPYAFLEDLLELRETIRFLRNPVYGLYKLAIAYRRSIQNLEKKYRLARDSKKLAKAIANVWLEYRFAFSPLLRSAIMAVEAYRDKEVKRPERRTSRASIEVPRKSDSRIVTKVNSRTFTYQCDSYSTGNVRAGILYEVSNPVNGLQFKYGLRFKDLPSGIWNIIPYSFMVDRVLDISSFTKGIVNLTDPNVSILAAWVTTKTERRQSIGVRSILESGYSSTISPDNIIDREFHFNRSVWEPTASDTIPELNTLGLVSDATKITDLLALIISNLKS